MYYPYEQNMMGNFGSFGILMFLMMVIFIVVITWVIVKTFNKTETKTTGPNAASSLEILKMRYAKGEIDETQFKVMKKNLE